MQPNTNPIKKLYLAIESFLSTNPSVKLQDLPNNLSDMVSWYSCLSTDSKLHRGLTLGDVIIKDIHGIKKYLKEHISNLLPKTDEDDLINIGNGYSSKKELLFILENIDKSINTHEDIIKLANEKLDSIYGSRFYIEEFGRLLAFNYLHFNGYECPERLFSRIISQLKLSDLNKYSDSLYLQNEYDNHLSMVRRETTTYYLKKLLNSEHVDLPNNLREELRDYLKKF